MHELSVTRGVLTAAVEAAERHGARRITAIDLVIGDLSSIVDESVQFYFDILSQGTLAEGAVLRFRRVPALVSCAECGHEGNAVPPLAALCPVCGSRGVRVTGGREFSVLSIEVDDEDPG